MMKEQSYQHTGNEERILNIHKKYILINFFKMGIIFNDWCCCDCRSINISI